MTAKQGKLAHYLAELKLGAVIPRPVREEWSHLMQRISAEGRIAEVDEETYFYFLEAIPPRFTQGSHFCFAEGKEPFRLFWCDHHTRRYFVRQLNWRETAQLCALSGACLEID